MLLLSHRYIFVFLHEMTRMYRGMRVRGFVPGTDIATMNAMGNFLGMLFVRSFERTQRVYDAMLCRGYDGCFPFLYLFYRHRKGLGESCFMGYDGRAFASFLIGSADFSRGYSISHGDVFLHLDTPRP